MNRIILHHLELLIYCLRNEVEGSMGVVYRNFVILLLLYRLIWRLREKLRLGARLSNSCSLLLLWLKMASILLRVIANIVIICSRICSLLLSLFWLSILLSISNSSTSSLLSNNILLSREMLLPSLSSTRLSFPFLWCLSFSGPFFTSF